MRFKNAISIVTMLFLLGCDPGIAIRQVSSVHRGIQTAIPDKITVEVSPFHTLAYSGWYVARIKITNSLHSDLSVSKVELSTREGVYANRLSDQYPVNVRSGSGTDLRASSELKRSLHESFKKPAELKVYYSLGNKEGAITTKLTAASR